VKLRANDRKFSNYIRARDNWRCVACGDKSKDYSENRQGLHCSHFFGRGRENTRFDPLNCVALCRHHHLYAWGHSDGRDEYKAYMIKRIGQDEFDKLEVRAHMTKKRDDKLDALGIEQLLKGDDGSY